MGIRRERVGREREREREQECGKTFDFTFLWLIVGLHSTILNSTGRGRGRRG
jgi:hypothetical protein